MRLASSSLRTRSTGSSGRSKHASPNSPPVGHLRGMGERETHIKPVLEMRAYLQNEKGTTACMAGKNSQVTQMRVPAGCCPQCCAKHPRCSIFKRHSPFASCIAGRVSVRPATGCEFDGLSRLMFAFVQLCKNGN